MGFQKCSMATNNKRKQGQRLTKATDRDRERERKKVFPINLSFHLEYNNAIVDVIFLFLDKINRRIQKHKIL